MVNNIFTNFTDQAKNFYEPAFKFNQIMLANVEKVARAQLESFKAYADMGIDQLHKASSIREFSELKDFMNNQAELAGNLSKKMTDDASRLMNLSYEFKDEMVKFTEENTKEM
ncbi:MAG: phasin family protein, partial [Pseudomonadota bacterium]